MRSRARHPAMTRGSGIGDIVEIRTLRGFAYAQYTHEPAEFGSLIRVLPGLQQPERYKARRMRDRFTSEMLEAYCGALGIEVFESSFYGPRAVLVRTELRLPPDALSLTLEEAQAWLEIIPGAEAAAPMPA